MHLAATLVTLSIVGFSGPMVAEMALMPNITQAKSTNFSNAENSANIFAAHSRANNELAPLPENCELEQDDLVYSVTCTEGQGRLLQTAKRTFELVETDLSGSSHADEENTDDPDPLWEGDVSTSGHEESNGDWHWRNNESRYSSKNSGCDKNR